MWPVYAAMHVQTSLGIFSFLDATLNADCGSCRTGWIARNSGAFTRARVCTLRAEIEVDLAQVLGASVSSVPALSLLRSPCVSGHVFNIKTGRCCGPAPLFFIVALQPRARAGRPTIRLC